MLCLFGQPRDLWKKRFKIVALPLLGAVMLAVTAYRLAVYYERAKLEGQFRAESELITEDLNNGMEQYTGILEVLNAFFSVQGSSMSSAEFRIFTLDLLSHYAGVQAISWDPLVQDSHREAFERSSAPNGGDKITIFEYQASNKKVPAHERSEYIVVKYIEPREKNIAVIGFDAASDPNRKATFDLAAETDRPVASGSIRLLVPGSKGVIIVQRALIKSGRPEAVQVAGFFVVALQMSEMLNAVLGPNGARKVALKITDQNGTTIYDNKKAQGKGPDFSITKSFEPIAGIKWKLTMEPAANFVESTRISWMVLSGGTLFVGLLGGFLFLLCSRNELLAEEITKRTIAQKAVEESETRKVETLESALDSIVTIDSDSRIIEFNRAAEATFHVKREDVLGRLMPDVVIPARMRQAHYTGLQRYLGTGVGPLLRRRIETIALRSDGSEFPVEISIAALRVEGRPIFTAFLRDITERKKIELERESILEKEKIARNLAEDAVRKKDEFLAIASHELRTPISVITGWLNCLRERETNQEITKILDILDRNAKLELQIIDDILDMSLFRRGQLEMQSTVVSINKIVEHAVEAINFAAAQKEIVVKVQFDQHDAVVRGDPERLQQILWNLLSNAVKFTPKGGKVDVDVARGEGTVQVKVRDTGIGIKPEFLHQIFEPFAQQDSSPSRTYGGLGLGLPIVKALTEFHGGTIVIESAGENRGSTVTVTFPLLPIAEELSPPEAAAPALEPHPLRNKKVLIVDDMPDVLTMLELMLKQAGAQVLSANSAERALHILNEYPLDAMVCDISMPRENGYDLMRNIRKLMGANANIPAVALSAHIGSEFEKQAFAAGFQVYLTKPAMVSVLLQTVTDLCGGPNVNISDRDPSLRSG
ncbi:MAG: ATP-binding protein [Oligoflexales bacterium]